MHYKRLDQQLASLSSQFSRLEIEERGQRWREFREIIEGQSP